VAIRNVLIAVGLTAIVAMLAIACAEDEPHITFIGVVDATPPRLGRPTDAGPAD